MLFLHSRAYSLIDILLYMVTSCNHCKLYVNILRLCEWVPNFASVPLCSTKHMYFVWLVSNRYRFWCFESCYNRLASYIHTTSFIGCFWLVLHALQPKQQQQQLSHNNKPLPGAVDSRVSRTISCHICV